MKKTLSLILAMLMVFSLVACGGGSSAPAQSSTPAASESSSGAASTETAKPERGNVIWTFGTADTGGSMYPAGAAVSQCWTNNVQGMKCNTQTS
ncbi:MAG: TAXI family TRAP transporter solute-binding subunit, partial [Oscillospiraceae bacterium]|nr:TAXI family TRAP transporter solute-binding subunit [Oscillospiraceae bacterium]